MGRAHGTQWGENKCMQVLLYLKVRENLKEFGVDGRDDNVKMKLKEMGWQGMDWISLADERGKWHTVVSMVMNLQVPQTAENFTRRTLLHKVRYLVSLSV